MRSPDTEIVIVATKRTPIGQCAGNFSTLSAPQIASVAIQATLHESKILPEEVTEVILGCVLPAGIGQAPARQAAMGGGLPHHVGATTINKMCGSGMKAIMQGVDCLIAEEGIVLAGGMESMTRAPYLLLKGRQGYRLGSDTLYDHMFLDGLEDAYDKGKLMGVFAENCAKEFELTREAQDTFALRSLERAQTWMQSPDYSNEIAPVSVKTKKETIQVDKDELPLKARPEKIPTLKPAFMEKGTVTAANSSGISDGAATHILMRKSTAQQKNIPYMASIVGMASHAQAPALFTTAPIEAIKKVLNKTGWTLQDVDLFEINEAFAVVTLASIKALDLAPEKVNIHGGACAMGHPIGASGARIVTTLVYALKARGLKRGVAAICIGGGEATALAVELCESSQ